MHFQHGFVEAEKYEYILYGYPRLLDYVNNYTKAKNKGQTCFWDLQTDHNVLACMWTEQVEEMARFEPRGEIIEYLLYENKLHKCFFKSTVRSQQFRNTVC